MMIVETFARVFVEAAALDRTIAFSVRLLAGEVTMRFAYGAAGLDLAAVSSQKLSVPLLAGPAEARKPFEATRLTVKVDRLEPYVGILADADAEQLQPIQPTPAGRKTRFRHGDGAVVGYVDHQDAGQATDRH